MFESSVALIRAFPAQCQYNDQKPQIGTYIPVYLPKDGSAPGYDWKPAFVCAHDRFVDRCIPQSARFCHMAYHPESSSSDPWEQSQQELYGISQRMKSSADYYHPERLPL
jgi:hypothetical protein